MYNDKNRGASLSNEANSSSVRCFDTTEGQRKKCSSRSKSRPTRGVHEYKNTFKKAFAKALFHRSRNLGRRLNPTERKKLAKAVAKQCLRTSSETALTQESFSSLVSKVNHMSTILESVPYKQPYVDALYQQLNVLRSAMISQIEESGVRSSCPHVMQQQRLELSGYYRSVDEPKKVFTIEVPVQGVEIEELSTATLTAGRFNQVCCQLCLGTRLDLWHHWLGTECPSLEISPSLLGGVLVDGRSGVPISDPPPCVWLNSYWQKVLSCGAWLYKR